MRILFFLLLPTLALAQRPAPTPPVRPAAARPIAAKTRTPLPASFVAWSAGRPLTVADFQGRPSATEPHAALASATIDAKGACSGDVFTAEVRAVFDPATSWVREPATMSAALLRHEQLHFDIAEIYARQLRLRLAGTHPNCAQLQTTFGRISQAVYSEWEREEARYDQETNHGLNAVQQAFWDRQTTVRLQQLAAYALKEAE